MNKTTLLTTGLVIGAVVAFGYGYLAGDVDSANNQQESHQEKSEYLQMNKQPPSLNSEAKPVTITSETSAVHEANLVDENSYARTPPPPPISSNKTKDGRYTTPQAHGHEEVHEHDQKNVPPPPTGSN